MIFTKGLMSNMKRVFGSGMPENLNLKIII